MNQQDLQTSGPGPVWIEDNDLHFVDRNGLHLQWRGDDLGLEQGRPGAVWVEGGNLLYVDAFGYKRCIPTVAREAVLHSDINHTDSPYNDHGDRSHIDRGVRSGTAEQSLLALLDALAHGQAVNTRSESRAIEIPSTQAHADYPHSDHTDNHNDHNDHSDGRP